MLYLESTPPPSPGCKSSPEFLTFWVSRIPLASFRGSIQELPPWSRRLAASNSQEPQYIWEWHFFKTPITFGEWQIAIARHRWISILSWWCTKHPPLRYFFYIPWWMLNHFSPPFGSPKNYQTSRSCLIWILPQLTAMVKAGKMNLGTSAFFFHNKNLKISHRKIKHTFFF